VAVAVRAEAAARLHPVLVDHPQRPEAHVGRVVVVGEGEGVVGVQPAVVGVAAVVCLSYPNHRRTSETVDVSNIWPGSTPVSRRRPPPTGRAPSPAGGSAPSAP